VVYKKGATVLYAYQPKTQSNHDAYLIPESVMPLKGLPLYLLVAHWGAMRGTPFFRDELAQAFGLTGRRAASVMTYLYDRQDKAVTRLAKKKAKPGQRGGRLYMQVYSVSESPQKHVAESLMSASVELITA
jgi:hypothetical protein